MPRIRSVHSFHYRQKSVFVGQRRCLYCLTDNSLLLSHTFNTKLDHINDGDCGNSEIGWSKQATATSYPTTITNIASKHQHLHHSTHNHITSLELGKTRKLARLEKSKYSLSLVNINGKHHNIVAYHTTVLYLSLLHQTIASSNRC